MAVPKKQRSKAKVRARRGKIVLKLDKQNTCKQCGSAKIAHTACAVCGTYKGKQIVDVEKREKRKEKKLKSEEEEKE